MEFVELKDERSHTYAPDPDSYPHTIASFMTVPVHPEMATQPIWARDVSGADLISFRQFEWHFE